MNIFEKKKIQYAKTVRILVWPNITFQEDLEKDSYIQVIKQQIKLLNEIRNDLWFYLILPKPVPSLVFDNVTQYYVPFPTYPPAMRSHFDVVALREYIGSDKDFDLIMSHLPEHSHALKNTLYNLTHHAPKFMGYCHWFDLDTVVRWPVHSFNQNIMGLLEYETCYLNTWHQKLLVLDQAKNLVNDKVLEQLDKILEVQHLGVNAEDITEVNINPERIIVFNHRPDTYKHYNDFLEVCDRLWNQRKDFKVWVPLAPSADREYITVEKGNKQWYYNKLNNCYMGVSPKQTYGGWSVATTDGLMNGVPYVMYNDTYYKELNPLADFFTGHDELLYLLNEYLDSLEKRNKVAQESLEHSYTMLYRDRMDEMSFEINKLVSESGRIQESEKLDQIIDWIKTSKSISKKEIMKQLGWGRGIKWTQYRQALLNHPNIFDVMDEYPKYCWRENNDQSIL